MNEFTAKYSDEIAGVLNGFDRLVFRGTLRKIAYPFGLKGYLFSNQVLLKEFGEHAKRISDILKDAAVEVILDAGRPVEYLQSSRADKEKIARDIAQRDGIEKGPVCALTCVEPCWAFDIRSNRESKQLELVQRARKCQFVYQYWQHPELGWMNARIQTWFPFNIQICLNGREWLARQLHAARVGYQKQDNCVVWVEDWPKAQQLLDQQLRTEWPQLLNALAHHLNPQHQEIFAQFPVDYYWSVYQSEWATDVVFGNPHQLQRMFPVWVHHAITTFQSSDVLRFLGKKLTARGEVPGGVQKEVTTSMKRRPQGTRIKHWYGLNSIKAYDKGYAATSAVLRTEMTMQCTDDFKVYRHPEGQPQAAKRWYRLRKGVADLHRRMEIGQKANERYLNALAAVDTTTTLETLIARIQQPVIDDKRRSRALHPFAEPDVSLLMAIANGSFMINGFRNRDLQEILYSNKALEKQEACRRSAAISRKLRLLHAHGLIRKISRTHRYCVTDFGKQLLPTILAARKTTLKVLNAKAA